MVSDLDIRAVVGRLAAGEVLDEASAERLFAEIMSGAVSPLSLSSILTAMRVRGESEAELRGAVRAVRSCMHAVDNVPERTIDVCGTGGDGLGTLNVSTAVAFVLAGLGVPVAKHGNRALSSRSGATDVLRELGVVPESDPEKLSRQLQDDGLIFLAAPLHHPAMRHAAEVRQTLGFRTLFNLLGPLCNPARVRRQFVGVFDSAWLDAVARTLGHLGSRCVWAAHGTTDRGGADELTLAGPSQISAWEDGALRQFSLDPDMAGLRASSIDALAGGDAADNARALRALLAGERGPYRDTVLLNAAVALHVAGAAPIVCKDQISSKDLRANVALAAEAIDTGAAAGALARAAQQATDNVAVPLLS